MSQQQRVGIGVAGLVVALIALFVFLMSGQTESAQQSEVLSELSELASQNSATDDEVTTAESDADPAEQEVAETDTEAEAATTTSPAGELASEPEDTVDDDVVEDDDTAVAETTTTTAVAEDSPTETEAPETTTAEATTTTQAEETTTTTATETTTQAPTTTEAVEATTTTEALATTQAPPTTEAATPGVPAVASFEVIETIPHDTGAFTQGLEISDGRLFESTGLVGRSSIRELDLETGETIRNTAIPDVFGEGLTIVGNTAIQLTWQDEIAFRYDLDTFQLIESHEYEGQGWGLCLASEGSGNLIMSDGSSQLEFRDPDTFESLGLVDVNFDGRPIENLNELECIGDTVWANIWLSSLVVEIDPDSGNVLTVLDIDELRPESTRGNSGAVWNGLAYDPADGTLLVTGKLWPTIFRLELSTN